MPVAAAGMEPRNAVRLVYNMIKPVYEVSACGHSSGVSSSRARKLDYLRDARATFAAGRLAAELARESASLSRVVKNIHGKSTCIRARG